MYSIKNNIWAMLPPLPIPHNNPVSAFYGGEIWLTGDLGKVSAFNPRTTTHRVVKINLPKGPKCMISANSSLYFITSENKTVKMTGKNDKYEDVKPKRNQGLNPKFGGGKISSQIARYGNTYYLVYGEFFSSTRNILEFDVKRESLYKCRKQV